VVLNASVVSVQGVPSFSVYSASKAAVRSFAQRLSCEKSPATDLEPFWEPLCRIVGISDFGPAVAASRPCGRQKFRGCQM
jgi:hypothetical protein